MKTPVVTSASRGWNVALLALATVALAATTTSAQTVTAVGQVGDGGAATNWSNTNCGTTGVCGSGPGSVVSPPGNQLGYNFAYSSVANAKSPGGNGISGNVEMDSNLSADSKCPTCGLLALEADNYNRAAIDYTFATVVGQTYTVSLDIGGTQQSGFSGPIDVLLGITGAGVSQSYDTGAEPASPAPFTGWEPESFSFVAGSTSETLAFLANSASGYITNQDPAFAVIDDLQVSTTTSPIPEPNSLILLGTGLAGLGGLVRSRFMKATV